MSRPLDTTRAPSNRTTRMRLSVFTCQMVHYSLVKLLNTSLVKVCLTLFWRACDGIVRIRKLRKSEKGGTCSSERAG